MLVVAIIAAVLAGAMVALLLHRERDRRAERREVRRLVALQPPNPPRFDPAMIADLPGPARRFFAHAILPGAALHTVAVIEMAGRFALGTKEAPGYVEMAATETLALPHGFLWAMRGGGLNSVSGSDSASWTRFRVADLIPVARIGGTPDHARSAFGRMVGEAVFWTPAAVLPRPGVRWELVDDATARVTVRHAGMEQAVDLTVDGDGRATQVAFMRWSDANPDKAFRLQPFGGYLSGYRAFGGFQLPTHVEAGNQFGTDAYFPFFVIDVTDARFPR